MGVFSVDGFAIITGGAGGIGKEIGFMFAESGARGVIFADLDSSGAIQAAEQSKKLAIHPGFKALGTEVDVTDAISVKRVVDLAVKEFGTIDYLVNSAGVDVVAYVPFTETTETDFDRVLNINTKGAFLFTQAVAKVMQGQEPRSIVTTRHGSRSLGRGSIVNIASALAFGAVPAKTPYITSKHALLGLTRSAAVDLNRAEIRVNMVCPTWVDTPMYEEEKHRVPQVEGLVKGLLAAGRPAGTDEVAAAVQYLCSPSAAYITGTSIMLDNGISAGPLIVG